MVRGKFRNLPNAYCLVHFACCREIRKMNDLKEDKLKEQHGGKPEEEIEESKESTG
jgi:hypothetical protein